MRPPAIGLESGPALSAGGAGSPVVAVRTDEARQAAAGTRDGSVLLLSVETERVTGAFRAPCEQSAMVFAHDPTGEERILVTGGTDGVIRVWDASGERRSWKAHEKAVTRIEGSRAGSLLSLSVAADEAAVWTLEGIRTTTMTASDATLSRDGTRVGWSRASHAWILSCLDVGTGEEVWSLPGHGASFPGRILDSKGERVVCRSSEGPRIHDLGSGASVPFPAGAPAYTAQFIDDGAVLLANGEAWICSTDGRCLERYPTAGAFGAFVTGRWLIATSYKLDTIRVNVWDRRSGEQILSAPTRRGFMASKSALLEDRVLAVASPSGSVVLHDLASGEPRSMPSSTTHLHALDFSADGSLLLTSGTSEHVELWDVASGRRVARHDLPARRVLDARMDPDPLILAQHYGQGLEITDPRSGRVSRRFAFDDIEMASLSPDGSRVVAASKKRGLVRVWDRRSGDLLLETMGDAASFDDRGGRVVVLSMETRAGVREVATGRDLLRVRRASSAVSAGGLSSDGRRLLTLSQDARRREDVPRSVVAWLRTLVQTDPVEPENRLAMIWDVDSGKVVSTAGVPLGTTQVAEGEGSGSLKVDAPWGGGVRLVDARTGEQKSVSTWAVQKPGEAAIQRAPDPTVLLFSSTSGVVHRLNHPAPVTCEAVGDHGAWVIAGCQDGSVHVWEALADRAARPARSRPSHPGHRLES